MSIRRSHIPRSMPCSCHNSQPNVYLDQHSLAVTSIAPSIPPLLSLCLAFLPALHLAFLLPLEQERNKPRPCSEARDLSSQPFRGYLRLSRLVQALNLFEGKDRLRERKRVQSGFLHGIVRSGYCVPTDAKLVSYL